MRRSQEELPKNHLKVQRSSILQCELLYYMDALELDFGRRALLKVEGLIEQLINRDSDGSSSSGYVVDAERARVDKVVSHKENIVVGPSLENNTLTEQNGSSSSEHVVDVERVRVDKGLGFENKNDVENPFVLSKAKELTPSLYNIDEMGKDLLSDDKIISEEELKCEVEKRLKTKDHNDSLIAQLNKKSIENAALNPQIQEKVFAIAALKNELRKSKGNSVDTKFEKPSILGKLPLQPLKYQSVVRQPNAFKSKRPRFSNPRFASQVDVKNDLSKLVSPPYWPNLRDHAFAKPHHVIASSESRNSLKNMPRFSSNDMVHNHYLEDAKKKTQERDRNSKTSVIPSLRLQNTVDGRKPKLMSTNQMTRN
ncbi:hypothetical protein Tco_1234981 [Tanacetum coccineum]